MLVITEEIQNHKRFRRRFLNLVDDEYYFIHSNTYYNIDWIKHKYQDKFVFDIDKSRYNINIVDFNAVKEKYPECFI